MFDAELLDDELDDDEEEADVGRGGGRLASCPRTGVSPSGVCSASGSSREGGLCI